MTANVILLSGGVDSAYLLTWVATPRIAVHVNYGQPAAVEEQAASIQLAEAVECELVVVSVTNMPLGDMGTKDNDSLHIVPARNLWLTAIAASFGHRTYGGWAPYDNEYPDCRTPFLERLRETLHSIGGDLEWSGAGRARRVLALEEKGISELTYSCYHPEGPCGKCKSCKQR